MNIAKAMRNKPRAETISKSAEKDTGNIRGIADAISARLNPSSPSTAIDSLVSNQEAQAGSDLSISDLSPVNRPFNRRQRGGSHCPWSSDTVRFMTKLHDEACSLREKIVQATCEAALSDHKLARVSDENDLIRKENASLRMRLSELEKVVYELQSERSRRSTQSEMN